MKYTTLVYTLSLALLSTSALAASLDETLALNPAGVDISKNYDGLYTNDDGRVTIAGPKFGSADGTNRWVSADSDLNGVCRLFGYGAAVGPSKLTDGDFDRTVVLNGDGAFSAFKNYASSYYNRRITSLMCETGAQPSASSRYDRVVRNDDRSWTIIGPQFGFADGKNRWVSADSDLDGVCRLFGYHAAVSAGKLVDGDFDRTIVLNNAGRFSAFKDYASSYYNRRITSLICH